MTQLKKFLNKNNFIVFIVTIYIFFWDVSQTSAINFDLRLIIFALSFFLLIEIIKDIKNRNFIFILISTVIFLFLIIHSFIVGNLLSIKFYFSVIFLIYLFGIVYYFNNVILENKNTIIYLFITLFILSILVHFFFNFSSNPEPVSCGALKNILGGKNSYDTPLFFIHFLSSYSLIYGENSHLAMSGIAVIIYSIFLITRHRQNKFLITFLFLFIIICFLKSSATLLAGTIFSIISLIIFEFKRLNKYFIIFSLILISIIVFVFFQDKVCVNKFALSEEDYTEIQKINPLTDNKEIKEIKKIEKRILIVQKQLDNNLKKYQESNDLSNDKPKNLSKDINELVKELDLLNEVRDDTLEKINEDFKKYDTIYQSSLSSEVFFHALKVTHDSIFNKPFGWGFQNYEAAFNDYNKRNKVYRKSLEVYNSKDASNTLFKIITEFGIFSLFLYLTLLYIFLSKKISIENKVFLIPFIVTQSIRGAGYFNGAFALILLLIIFSQFKKQNNQRI